MKELKSFRAESMKGWLFLLTAALMTTACSSTDDSIVINEPQPADTPPTYTVSIDATRTPDADLTRALALEGNTLNASWAETDVVAVMKNTQITLPDNQTTKVWKIVGYLKPANISSDGLSCTLSGSITGSIATDDKLQLVYPGQEIVEVEDGDVESQSQDFSIVYLNQDGTLEKIAKEYDYCRTPQQLSKAVEVTAVDGTSITTSAATFTSNQAIVKFILTDKDSGNPINAKELSIDATNTNGSHELTYFEQLTVPNTVAGSNVLKIYPSGSSNVVYAALSGINDCKVSLTATDYINIYEYEKSGVTFTHGKYYAINVKMTKKSIPPVAVEPSLSTPYSVGQYIGSDGKFYEANATLPEGVTKMALVAYVGNESNCEHGLAIAMSDDGGTTSWGAAVQRAAEHTPTVLNATWRLPTMTDLQRMFIASGSNGSYKDDLHMPNKQEFNSSGFVTFLQNNGASVATGANDRYWSASHTSYSAWSYSFNTTRFYSSVQNMSYRVRAVLAF